MCKAAILVFSLIGPLIATCQSVGRTLRKTPGTDRPVCSAQAICFSGEVSVGEEFRKTLNAELEFVLKPSWNIAVARRPESDCGDFANVVNPPYRAHRSLYIDMSYGWTAEDEVATSPREFDFVTTCADYRRESERLTIVLWPYAASPQKYEAALAKLGSSPLGKGRLWITDSKISHADDTPDEKPGKIQWMRFSVEIRLPRR